MIFAFLLLLQMVRYNVEGKHFLVETKDGVDQRKVCKINVQCYVMVDHHQVGNDYHNEKLPENLLSYGLGEHYFHSTFSNPALPLEMWTPRCRVACQPSPSFIQFYTMYLHPRRGIEMCICICIRVYVIITL